MSIVEIENLTFSYSRKEIPVINDFSFSMKKGEIVDILGQSGSGKSTILRLIAGLELPMKGIIKIASKIVVSESVFSIQRKEEWEWFFKIMPYFHICR